ncbi:MAG: imidazolonepropionase [Myxococcota bacterium]
MTLDLSIVGGTVVTASGTGDAEERLDVRACAVGIKGERIVSLGEPQAAAKVIDAAGAVVLPGLVDPHTHLVFAGSRADEFAARMSGVDYQTIAAQGGGIASTVRATRDATEDELFDLGKARILALRESGVTAVEIKSGYGLSVDDELRLLRVARRLAPFARIRTTFLGAHAVPAGIGRETYVDQVVHEQLPAVAEAGVADACDVYCDEGAFTLSDTRRILEAARDLGLDLRVHAGQFADLGAAGLAAELGALSADHLEEVSGEDLRALATAEARAVFLPGAWRTLRQAPPHAARFRDAGVRIAIGTDLNPGTSPTSDLLLMASLAVRDAHLTPAEALLGITTEAAAAAGFSDGVGTLFEGGPADVAIVDATSPASLTYAFGGLRARTVILRGEVVHQTFSPRLW